ncbi:hypothetical protein GCM10008904_25930 [Paraclostridium ghonii]|uniref:Uncharacterized protein n=1 Tax=Paraclostridium ghonii TaxID=29358 RepID=A0ABU0N018_9FIRM|nr:hypothetical protein [Paeniclostridium ghonii]MDQ0556056.1 hypothetical protein [Paeniclostridium ghonii]
MNNENSDLKFSNHKNYCDLGGRDLSKIEIDSIKLSYEKKCIKCDEIYDSSYLYCKECGNELISIKENRKILNSFNVVDKDLDIKEKLAIWISSIDIKRRIIVPIFSILVLCIVSIWIKLFMNITGLEVNKFLNIFNIILGLNLVPVKIASSSSLGVGNIDISMSLISVLILPFIVIGISSMFFIKKEALKNQNVIKESFMLSLIYGLLLGFISILGKRIINFSMEEYYTMSVVIKYSFIRSVLNGIIISFIPIYIVLFNKIKCSKKDFNIINKALQTIALMYVLILVLIVFGLFFNKVFLSNSGVSGVITYPQLALYLLHFINLIPVRVGHVLISIFNISDINLYLNDSMILLVYAMMLLNIVILIVSGYDIKNKVNDKKYIKHFSFVYSIAIAGTIFLSKIDTSGSLPLLDIKNYDMYSYIGSSAIMGLVISFIYSYIILSLGYKLNKE